MNDGQGLRVVALCDPASKRPIVGGALNDVLRTVAETGGVPPRARGHVWRVMSLSKLREKAGGHTNALFYALHAFNPATAMGRKAHELLPKIHNFCVWRVLNPELDHNKRPERVYGVATRAQQRMMSAAVTLEAYLCVLADALQARDPGLLQTMILSIHNLIGFAEQNPSLFRGGGNGKRMAPTELSEYATKLAQALERRRTASDRDLGIGWTEERKLEAGKAVIALRDNDTVHPLDYYAAMRIVMLNGADPPTPTRDASQCFARAVYDWSAHAPMLAMVFDPTDVASKTAHEMAAPAYVRACSPTPLRTSRPRTSRPLRGRDRRRARGARARGPRSTRCARRSWSCSGPSARAAAGPAPTSRWRQRCARTTRSRSS